VEERQQGRLLPRQAHFLVDDVAVAVADRLAGGRRVDAFGRVDGGQGAADRLGLRLRPLLLLAALLQFLVREPVLRGQAAPTRHLVAVERAAQLAPLAAEDRKSTRLNS